MKTVPMKKTFPSKLPFPFSNAVRAGDFVFVSGQLAFGPDGKLVGGGIENEARVVLENVKAALAQAGCEMSDVVKTTVWIVDRADFPAFNKVYREFFPSDPPTRATVRCDLILVDAKIEIEVVAWKPL